MNENELQEIRRFVESSAYKRAMARMNDLICLQIVTSDLNDSARREQLYLLARCTVTFGDALVTLANEGVAALSERLRAPVARD